MVQISHRLALLGLGSTALARGLPRQAYEYGATTVTVTDCGSASAVTSYLTVTVTPDVCFPSMGPGSCTESGRPGQSSSEVVSATAASSDTGVPSSVTSAFSTLTQSASPELTTESSEGSLPINSASATASEVPTGTGTEPLSSSPASTESEERATTINFTSSETCVTGPHPESTESAQPTSTTGTGSDDNSRTDSSSPELATSPEDGSTATSSGLYPESTSSGALTESSSPELNTSVESSSNTTSPEASTTAAPTSFPSPVESIISSPAQPSETEYPEGSYDEGLRTEDSDAATGAEEAWTTQNDHQGRGGYEDDHVWDGFRRKSWQRRRRARF
ncbi:uncharacterized protein DNG_01720 [Cephalotrichum gorgonifer]|uniref:Uncharacterized protein n=1 Tax=Cephalotrichum gorgonifer TaxID=2041049 RepID=A0AAE8SRW2_9PEZI|nr:uncharacterized protein DNG_01720 [Cephalotrichum gorgonifer]